MADIVPENVFGQLRGFLDQFLDIILTEMALMVIISGLEIFYRLCFAYSDKRTLRKILKMR